MNELERNQAYISEFSEYKYSVKVDLRKEDLDLLFRHIDIKVEEYINLLVCCHVEALAQNEKIQITV